MTQNFYLVPKYRKICNAAKQDFHCRLDKTLFCKLLDMYKEMKDNHEIEMEWLRGDDDEETREI